MEALLLTVEFALMTWLVYTIVRRDHGERSGRNLGFFRYKEAPTAKRAPDSAAGGSEGADHA